MTPTHWIAVQKFTPAAARLADGHYSRRTIGSPQFMPPGQTLVLMTANADAVFGWWRPHPGSGITAMNGLDGWTCTIFRNTGPILSSELVLEAERELLSRYDCGPDGLITYVWDKKVASVNPGYCFKVAGWRATGRSADGRKTLLQKFCSDFCSVPDRTGLGLGLFHAQEVEATSGFEPLNRGFADPSIHVYSRTDERADDDRR